MYVKLAKRIITTGTAGGYDSLRHCPDISETEFYYCMSRDGNRFGKKYASLSKRKAFENITFSKAFVAPPVGLEPTTLRLTAACSTN